MADQDEIRNIQHVEGPGAADTIDTIKLPVFDFENDKYDTVVTMRDTCRLFTSCIE